MYCYFFGFVFRGWVFEEALLQCRRSRSRVGSGIIDVTLTNRNEGRHHQKLQWHMSYSGEKKQGEMRENSPSMSSSTVCWTRNWWVQCFSKKNIILRKGYFILDLKLNSMTDYSAWQQTYNTKGAWHVMFCEICQVPPFLLVCMRNIRQVKLREIQMNSVSIRNWWNQSTYRIPL